MFTLTLLVDELPKREYLRSTARMVPWFLKLLN